MNERAATRCLLYADVAGRIRLAVKLGEAEAGYAVERCLNRMSRCAEAYSAEGLELRPEVIVAHFGDADSALLAAREMRERVRALPPMSGIKLVLRAGVVLESEGGAEKVGPRRWLRSWWMVAIRTPSRSRQAFPNFSHLPCGGCLANSTIRPVVRLSQPLNLAIRRHPLRLSFVRRPCSR